MSDTSQGPGWWLASDGKWYPPESAPIAAAPWQSPPEKKKFYTRVWFWLLVAMVVLFGGCSAIVFGTAKAVTDATNHLTPNGTTSGGPPATNPGCAKNPPAYPDQQKAHDCVALPDGSASLAGASVTAANWARSQDSIGISHICAGVTIKNNNTSTISFSEFEFKLQSPTGTVTDATISLSNSLSSGDLVPGGTASGDVCFEDPGATGTYVGIYKPNPFSASRAIWLVPL
jgi:hypothetical protein